MNAARTPQDPYLDLPLHGLRLIEASAGTGKTFTLATLFTRLVVERGLRMGQILAVTFTDAATQELRKRIRERLDLAARLVGVEARADDGPETALTHAILQRHLAQGEESAAQLARRLRIAAEETDLAAIFTIHGFCTRVLGEHALESGHSFAAPELLTNTRQLHAELAADLWRQHATRADALDALLGLWKTPEALAADLPVLIADLPLRPEVPATVMRVRAEAFISARQAATGPIRLPWVSGNPAADNWSQARAAVSHRWSRSTLQAWAPDTWQAVPAWPGAAAP